MHPTEASMLVSFQGDTSASANTLCKYLEMDVFLIRFKHCVRTDPIHLPSQGHLAKQPMKEAKFPSLPTCHPPTPSHCWQRAGTGPGEGGPFSAPQAVPPPPFPVCRKQIPKRAQ